MARSIEIGWSTLIWIRLCDWPWYQL